MNDTSNSPVALEAKVRRYVADTFGANESRLSPDLSLLHTGIIDSTGYLDLFAWLKEEFEIDVDDGEMHPDNFETIGKITQYITRKRGSGKG